MLFLVACTTICSVRALRLFERNYSALELMQNHIGEQLSTIQVMLHSLIDVHQLLRFLEHPSLPFATLYEESCHMMIDNNRIHEIWKDLVTSGLGHKVPILLSPECLSNATGRLRGRDLKALYPEGYLFGRFPVTSDSDSSHIQVKAKIFIDQLSQTYERYGLVQDCRWMTHSGTPTAIISTSPNYLLGSFEGWKGIHHSCYRKIVLEARPDLRSCKSVEAILESGPYRRADSSPLIGPINCQNIARWSLHLLLILIQQHDSDLMGFTSIPLKDNLQLLKRRIIDRLQLETESILIHQLKLISKMITSGISVYQRLRTSIMVNDDDMMKRMFSHKIPDFENLLELLGNGDDVGRWKLLLLEFYHRADSKYWLKIPLMKEILIEILPRSTLLEQHHWIFIFLSGQQLFDFLRPTILRIVGGSEILQKRLMNDFADKDDNQVSFLVEAIPFKQRLLFSRENFVNNRFGHLIAEKALKEITELESENFRQQAMEYFRLLEKEGLFLQWKGESWIHLPASPVFELLAFVFATSALFRIPMPVQVPPSQIRVLLGYSDDPEIDWGLDGTLFDRVQISDKFREVKEVANLILPPIITWEEAYIMIRIA